MEEITQWVEVSGAPEQLRFPDLCARCATPTNEHLYVEKPAVIRARRVGHYGTEGFRVPFCTSCIDAHRIEAIPVTPARVLRRMLLHPMTWFPLPFAVAGLVLILTVLDAIGHENWPEVLEMGLLCAFWNGVLFSFARNLWSGLRQYCSAPRPTSITRAFDFKPQQHRRRRYALRNPIFGSEFIALNGARRIRHPMMATIRRKVFGLLMVLIVVLMVVVGGGASF